MPLESLPIDALLPSVGQALKSHQNLVIQASPGSGKTTRVPPYLLDAGLATGKVLVLVPRRLAAKTAATRVASERGVRLGEDVGYQFRFENALTPQTRLIYLTEGLLVRRLISDPQLVGVSVVVLDEFHERHLHTDVAIAHLKRLQASTRPDLKLIVMSATLDAVLVARYLNEAPVLTLESPRFPIQLDYLGDTKRNLETEVLSAVSRVMRSERRGDTLVFLPGMADIRRCEAQLVGQPDLAVLSLHGDLEKDEQERIFQASSKPKVILATNIAESSLTIPGITCVIDSGLHRQAAFSWWSGLPSLSTKTISQASAIQRMGRAGRTGAGLCLRLYSQADFDGRPAYEIPEIRRSDLAQTLLELLNLGVTDFAQFPWFEKPDAQALSAAVATLIFLGAAQATPEGLQSTTIGRQMTNLPLAPRLARFMLAAKGRGVADSAATLAARLSEGEWLQADFLEHLGQPLRSESTRKLAGQIRRVCSVDKDKILASKDEALGHCVLEAFADRVALKRVTTQTKGGAPAVDLVLCGGGHATLARTPEVDAAQAFVILDVSETRQLTSTKAALHVRGYCPISTDWLLDLDNGLLIEENLDEFSDERIWSVERLLYGKLVLSEARKICTDALRCGAVLLRERLGFDEARLLQAAPADVLEAFRKIGDPEGLERAMAKYECLRMHRPELGLGELRGEPLCLLVTTLFGQGVDHLTDHASAKQALLSLLPLEAQSRLNGWLPDELRLPSGRSVAISYALSRSPTMASRLQDFFGLMKTPTLLDGRLPLTVELLAPNRRPVQVTQDLASFWQKTYAEVRRELMRRYPRHKWPENPMSL
jgi:ATP-dependent helicase HrpB